MLPSSVHLIIPGLMQGAQYANRANAYSKLLKRGKVQSHPPPISVEHWLCHAFGIYHKEPACGALRLLGEGGNPADDAWLCADPVYLRFARYTFVVDTTTELDLSSEEIDQVMTSLNRHFTELGEFQVLSSQQFYLRLPISPDIQTTPLSTVHGRQVQAFMPQGADGLTWQAILNEIQMLLHDHPVNIAREASGKPSVNSLWLWGAGSLPESALAPAPAIYADNLVMRGLAKVANVTCQPLPVCADALLAACAQETRQQAWVLLESLILPAQNLDQDAWNEAFATLEKNWFHPLLRALKSGKLKHLRMSLLGDQVHDEVSVSLWDSWKLWRRTT